MKTPLEALAEIRSYAYYRQQIVKEWAVSQREVQRIPLAATTTFLENPLRSALETLGVHALYGHQYRSLERLQHGENVVITAPTASGKSLCYQLSILSTLLKSPTKKALLLYPTKALAQDQFYQMKRLVEASPELMSTISLGFYDGDTSESQRKKTRQECNVVFSNPDMLHHSILPTHGRWGAFFGSLEYVVLDEAHLYRGVFGSHVALVLRRLKRLAQRRKGESRSLSWILCSATIQTPLELSRSLVGEPFEHVEDALAPRKSKHFVFWKEEEENARYQSALRLIRDFHKQGQGCILFVQTRVQCELVGRYLKEEFENSGLQAEDVLLYRGGYSAKERRAMEKELRERKGKVVVSTSALEVGIDIGHLDVAVLFGFPRSMSSFWQQAGRAGRGNTTGLVLFMAAQTPVDQYLLKNPSFVLERSRESVYLDCNNPYILSEQIKCAAHEFPLSRQDELYFGSRYLEVIDTLKIHGDIKELQGRWHLPVKGGYAGQVNIRSFGGTQYQLYDEQRRDLGQIDALRIQRHFLPGSIYLMWGNTYQVQEVIDTLKEVHLNKVDANYFTKTLVNSSLEWIETLLQETQGKGFKKYGKVMQHSSIYQRKRIQFHTGYVQGVEHLEQELPVLSTVCTLFHPSSSVKKELMESEISLVSALLGLQNLLEYTLPISTLSDATDLQVVIEYYLEEDPVLAILDVYPEGIGLSQKVFEQATTLLYFAHNVLESCNCEKGCPSCTGYEIQSSEGRERLPHKMGATMLLNDFLGR